MAAPPPPTSRGWLADLIASIFAYIDKPWKAITVVALILVGSFCWIIYDKRDELLEAWLTPLAVELKVSDAPEALAKLIADTDADLIQIWSVDLVNNAQTFVAARRRDGERPVVPTPRRLPIIINTADVQALVEILEGRPACVDLETAHSPLATRLVTSGMKRGCAVPIPPRTEILVGVIYLAWAEPPKHDNEVVAIGVARELAKTMATH
jgi:hypothetical protein